MEAASGVTTQIDYQPEQPGDVPVTYTAVEQARALLGYAPQYAIRDGLRKFAAWYQKTYVTSAPALAASGAYGTYFPLLRN